MRALILLIFLAGAMAQSVLAAATGQRDVDLFMLSGVRVDRSAASASIARRQALEDAQAIAWVRLIDKLAAGGAVNILPEASPPLMQNLVRAVDIRDERSSATRYIATVDVSFSAEEVRKIFGQYGVSYTESAAGPWLLLPLYEADGARLLLEPNPWRTAVETAAADNRLIGYALPQDDLAARRRIAAEGVATAGDESLAALSSAFRTSRVVLLSAEVGFDYVSGRDRVDWRLEIGPLSESERGIFSNDAGQMLAEDGEDRQRLLNRLAGRLLARLDASWKAYTLVDADKLTELRLVSPTTRFEDWNEIRRRLQSVALVRSVAIERISVPQSAFRIIYVGSEQQITLALAESRLALDGQTLRLRGQGEK